MNREKIKTNTKKRILTLNYEFPPLGGGASPVSYEIAKGFVEKGYEVDVVTMGYRGLPSFEKVNGINVYRVKSWRRKKEVCSAPEQLTYLLSARKFLKKHMKTHHYDICHTHFIVPTGALAWWVKKKYNLDYVMTAHGSDVPSYNTDRFKLLHIFTPPFLRKICNEAKLITTPSSYLKELIIEKISSSLKDKIIPLPNGSKDFYKKGTKKENMIYSCGRLLERKGYQYLIKAFNELNPNNWKLYIVGDGPYKEELLKITGGNKNVVFTGWLNHSDDKFVDIMNKSKVFALLSKSESQGIVYLEAMSTGCAMLASNITACAETVTENVGYLVKREDVKEIKRRLKQLLEDDKLLKTFMKNSRKRYDDNYTWNNIIKKYIDLFFKAPSTRR